MECELDWKEEAGRALEEVRYAIRDGWVGDSSRECAYLNLTTREGDEFCVQLSWRGFQVVGNGHNDVSIEEGQVWETVYALMSHVSLSYTSSFSQRLADQLNRLDQERGDGSEKDDS